MDGDELEKWASAYIEAQSDPKSVDEHHPKFWAVMRFFEIGHSDPEACWSVILKILSKNPPDAVIQVLSAGPLEDLIAEHGATFIDRIEAESRRDSDFRHLLGGVWQSTSSDEIWARIQKSRGKEW